MNKTFVVTFFHKGAFKNPWDQDFIDENRPRLSKLFDSYEDAEEFAERMYAMDFDYFIITKHLHV